MSNNNGVEFIDEEFTPRVYQKDHPRMIHFIMKISGGKIKTPTQANYILLSSIVVALILSFVLFNTSTEIESPGSELINTPQPQEGYIPQ